MTLLKELPPEDQTRVLKLHHEAFGGDSACKQCPGNCCAACAANVAYRDDEWQDPKGWKALKREYGWDRKLGFKGETGCKLPLTERSHVCLGFQCGGEHYEYAHFTPPEGVNKPFTEEQRDKAFRIFRIIRNH